jgi:cyclophilin family peptidyl-prolyl cis-trans isomerase
VLAAWEQPLPTEAAASIPNPADVADLASVTGGPDARPRVVLHTNRGRVTLALRPDVAPVTIARFLELVAGRRYDGLTFHRVVPGFVVQGGDPRGDGYGGPGFWQRCEDSRLPYRRGTVGMALAGRDTGGSQFFIAQAAQPHLEARYTAFAEVVEGLDVVDLLQVGDRIERAERLGAR